MYQCWAPLKMDPTTINFFSGISVIRSLLVRIWKRRELVQEKWEWEIWKIVDEPRRNYEKFFIILEWHALCLTTSWSLSGRNFGNIQTYSYVFLHMKNTFSLHHLLPELFANSLLFVIVFPWRQLKYFHNNWRNPIQINFNL